MKMVDMLCIHAIISKIHLFLIDKFSITTLLVFFKRYLNANGKLQSQCNDDSLFSAEYHGGHLALRDR